MGAEYVSQLETYMKLALRAQSQCRATLEAISAIKNPPMMGNVKQANIAHGPQQVNNGTPTKQDDPSRTRENQNPPTQLLEQTDGNRLDTGATGTTGKVDPTMATVGAVNGAKDARR